ncbi:MAG: HAD-IC family P-type ATPase [Burkholderiales bacterium]|nr:HAD-IC family P-type ATPase [Burkholderiales bacterium]
MHRAHARSADETLQGLDATHAGLAQAEVAERLRRFGYNLLPRPEPPSLVRVFLRQFLSPLIYILLVAALVSLFLEEWTDAGFIFLVLLVNAVVGAWQEYSAQRSALSLRSLVTAHARVLRAGDAFEIDAEEIVPGDIVLLESGSKVPADLRLIEAHGFEVDESLLTGESMAVAKDARATLPEDSGLAERVNMAFAGTLVTRGRAHGVAVATGLATELGRIASAVLTAELAKPPLLERMERFTFRIAIAIGVAVALMAAVALARGTPPAEIFFLAVALAVSAIPEGLPVALTVALAVGMQRMARRGVIVRKLVAVETLGSCTFIASDKTGTLTVNQLTARSAALPGFPPLEFTGEGTAPEGDISTPEGRPLVAQMAALRRLCRAAVLANEAFLGQRDGKWVHHGDAVDVALLVMAHKAGMTLALKEECPELGAIAYEPELRYCASLNRCDDVQLAFAKGAIEAILPTCAMMATERGDVPLDAQAIELAALAMADSGYRVLALAEGRVTVAEGAPLEHEHLRGLTFLGLVGMIDPLRAEAAHAVAECRRAGIEVSMVTGDHPVTALAIARQLGMASENVQVITGAQLKDAAEAGDAAVDVFTANARVFARMEPQQKLEIVRSLIRLGHVVAVTGDGANDAPALRAAHVGVAMGKSGTDVARETADIIVTDDNFASIVAGVEEGRIAYANVRKVIFLLISTGAAEIVLFALALFAGLPLPLVAVQLLWLNLVTNGIQDVALAFEPAEGHELGRPPRPPQEPVFNRLMLERVALSAAVIGGLAFAAFQTFLAQGHTLEEARNATLLLMVLFENVQAFNSRSETLSVFSHSPLRNRLLLFGTLAAQLIHVAAMLTPGVQQVLSVQSVSPLLWLQLLGLALVLLAALEAHKALLRRR